MASTVVSKRFSPLLTAPAHFTRGILAERTRANLDGLLRRIDVGVMQRTYAETHDGWYAEPEFCGQYVDSALAAYRATGDTELLARAGAVVEAMIAHQRADGYLGTYRPGLEFDSFSVWNQQFSIMALLTFYEQTGEGRALSAALRCADYLRAAFLAPGGPDLLDAVNWHIQNSCILIEFVHLYRLTGNEDCLKFADFMIARWDDPAMALVSGPLRHPHHAIDAVGSPKALEVLICYRGILALYHATGETRYLNAVRNYWQHVLDTQIGPTGNGSIAEIWWWLGKAPIALTNDLHPNENCVAVAWMQICAELLACSGHARFADEFEKTLYNHLLGAQALDGSDFSYYQGLEGRKVHKTPASWYSCCRYRGMKMFAHLGEWAVLSSAEGPVIALFAALTARVPVGAQQVDILQETDYPRTGRVTISVRPECAAAFTLRIRKPGFCPEVMLTVNGASQPACPVEDGFLCLTRTWSAAGDTVALDLTMPVTSRQATIQDDRESVLTTYGPLVLAIDSRYGTPLGATRVDGAGAMLPLTPQEPDGNTWTPIVRFTTPGTIADAPAPVTLVDYASAGSQNPAQDKFQVWVPIDRAK